MARTHHATHQHARAQERPSKNKARRVQKAAAGPCPVMHECGGCAWLGMPYRKQLARKQATTEELFAPLLKRFAWNIAVDPVRGMGACAGETDHIASPRSFRYKAATPFAPGPHKSIRCGFFARGTHHIVETPACAVEAPGARAILNGVARVAERYGIPAYDEDSRRGVLRYAVLRMGWRTDEALLTVVTAQRDIPHLDAFAHELALLDPRIVGIAQNVNAKPGNAILGNETRTIWGADYMHDKLLGCTFDISPTAFYQTNPQQTEVLYQVAIDDMELETGDTVLDTYCGSGTIGLTAARAAADAGKSVRLIGVERNAASIDDARRNALQNGLGDTTSFVAEDATAYLRRAAKEHQRVDVLVLDPPRAGSTPAFLRAAAELAPRRIVYISCNPTTQVRDLELLGDAGFVLTRITPVDMFPHSDHIEAVACLTHI